jgi:2,4-diketo-3-deoxy-L-fuconate hydrolase
MKLVRYGQPGKEKPGLIDSAGKIRDISSIVPDLAGDYLGPAHIAKIAAAKVEQLPLVDGNPRLGPCVAKPGNFIAIGLNYSDHAAETGAKIPAEPILFNKAPNSICGPNDDIMFPRDSVKLDWEAEIAFVIGTTASYVSEADAPKYIAGYFICNDVSEREFQVERSGQWTKGKSAPTFGPIGPWLVTPDEIKDVGSLGIWLDVNGARQQSGNTKNLIFNINHLVSAVSKYMTLDPGDIITTGTPAGVALGRKPPNWLKAGDVVTLGIEGLGQQTSKVVAFKGA